MATSHHDLFKPKVTKLHSFTTDVDGRQVKIETREDEEQQIKYQEIIRTLVEAGYYRACIKGLSPFDMVVGGITWCIDTSELDIDVDLLFEEGLTIGQKIALTEKIVAVLPKIKCPYFIEPHQIQGLDFIHILPVVQWLIKWSTENRQKKAEYLKSYAVNQFHKKFPNAVDNVDRRKVFENIRAVQYKYEGERIFKCCDVSNDGRTELEKVEGTLAEYGELSTTRSRKNSGHVTLPIVSKIKTAVVNEILRNVNSTGDTRGSQQNVAESVEEDVQKLLYEKEDLEKELDRISKEQEQFISESEQDSEVDLSQYTEEERRSLNKLQNLLKEHEDLKQREKVFKDECKSEMVRLQNEIVEMEEANDKEEIESLKLELEQWEEKLKHTKQELGKKTRGVLSKEKLLDDIPTRAELAQYQKRFMELYNQIAIKHKETKHYYALFNSLTDKCQYLKKEYNLLNSICDSYMEAFSGSKNKRDEFLRQLNEIKLSVDQTRLKLLQKVSDEKRTKEKLTGQLEFLHEQRRRYLAAVKEFSAECKENEKLIAQIRELSEDTDFSAFEEEC